MNFTKLKEELELIVQDDSADITTRSGDLINEALGEIAEDVNPPGLKETFTVMTTTAAYASLPSNFSGRMTYAGTSDGELGILSEIEMLHRKYPGIAEAGDVAVVVPDNDLLYYQPIPSVATAITCIGYMDPDVLVEGTDTPEWIPFFLHRELVVYKAASIAYNMIEDGVDSPKINTTLYTNLYNGALKRMLEWVRNRTKRVTTVKHYI
jgi:hypothetical protein